MITGKMMEKYPIVDRTKKKETYAPKIPSQLCVVAALFINSGLLPKTPN
jgi:hypothetical protein